MSDKKFLVFGECSRGLLKAFTDDKLSSGLFMTEQEVFDRINTMDDFRIFELTERTIETRKVII